MLTAKPLFTLGIIVVYRVGTHVPMPGVDYGAVQECVTVGTAVESRLQQRHYEGFLR